ncbi:glycosyltransferase [Aliarcobacter cryaerophilus]|uniref:glycosyltransferase n=1 Tax=Aliarcobacter cryaerophilus TaxID=28198 RepID=UPI0021B3A9E6|nr:glycosyltransferase [Aliarcobacter cryaerophilus]MCT7445505.1 glycosyltransferase [Aliarcobacter cryaerophilus]MCT7480431.1 glycosyltransferase [Aliarcobacter cryaerophilus]
MKKICIVVSTPMTVKAFLLKHIETLSKEYEITIVSNSNLDLSQEYKIKCLSKYIPINRKINFLEDIKSVILLYKFLKKENFNLVLSVSPKAGLISSISSFLARIENRIHFFTGQVWATKRGVFRFILKSVDKLIATLNTNNLIDSPSQKEFLIREKVIQDEKSTVLLSGSISGVDVNKFSFSEEIRLELKDKYKIKNSDIVFMFIGRLNTDKGIFDLVLAFDKLLKEYENVKLFLIGPDEENIENQICEFLKFKNVIRIDYVSNPQEILNIADVLVLPSYREGFGTIVIEAASMGIPCIASNIYGLNDAIVNNKTGLLHKVKDIDDMIEKYEYLIENKNKIKEYGVNAKVRVYNNFKDEQLSNELKKYIDKFLKK